VFIAWRWASEPLLGVLERHSSRGVKTDEIEELDGLRIRQEDF
jgi:hypothetical protein